MRFTLLLRSLCAFAILAFSGGSAALAQDQLCASPANACGARVQSGCLSRMGAGSISSDVAADSACASQLSGYRECLILVVQQCETSDKPKEKDQVVEAPEACPRDIEVRLWDAIKDSDDATLIRHFLDTCENSALAPIASAKLAALENAAAVNPGALAVCPTNFEGRSGALSCRCEPDMTATGSVWGSGLYTTDSSICRAAVHAGVIDARGGPVELIAAPGQPSYSGTSRNGVSTSNWGAYQASFLFPGAAEETSANAGPGLCPPNFTGHVGELTCVCQPSAMRGSVWGSGVYTADSSICRAALHAGVVSAQGGVVTLRAEAGQTSYEGTLRNGVTTGRWGSYQASFVFDGVSAGQMAEIRSVCPANVQHLRGQSTTLSCTCPAGAIAGSVWGDGVYTDDSSVCRAAVHAGRIDAGGGSVTLEIMPAQSSYEGANRNGVDSASYGAWGGSYRFING